MTSLRPAGAPLAAAFIAMMTMSAAAQTTSPSADTLPAPTAGTRTLERGKVAGTVSTIDPSAGTIDLKTNAGVRHFKLTPRTRILLRSKPTDLSKVRKGASVRALRFDKKTNEVLRLELGSL